ncbi:MAG: DHH family phosphoesterase [Pseudomonadota bacterium]
MTLDTPVTLQVQIKRRPVDPARFAQALSAGFQEVFARIVAAREVPLDTLSNAMKPRLQYLDSPESLADMDKAVTRLCAALIHGEVIALETDHDCDGQTSHAVLYQALTQYFGHPKDKVLSFIGHRLTEGYGLSQAVAERILATEPRPTVVITADNGSSDEPRIKILKEAGIDVIVTDHHEIPTAGIPKSAWAVINPTREDSQYPDPFVAGCMVAWLLMAATRRRLIADGKLPKDAPSLSGLLDYVAVGTVADCVSMAKSINNRAVVRYGIQLMEQRQRPCWSVIFSDESKRITTEDLGFTVGPLLNSDGRLSCAMKSVSFLLADGEDEAQDWLVFLGEQNQKRKTIQHELTEQVRNLALSQIQQGKNGLCVYLQAGHVGVQGICASRVKDAFGRPIVVFSDKQGHPGLITGSARGIDGLHLKRIFDAIHQQSPTMMVSYGGHRAAAGVTIKKKDFVDFAHHFHECVSRTEADFGPVLWTDGHIEPHMITTQFIHQLDEQLAPFGREFDVPCFEISGTLKSLQSIGDGTHARLQLHTDHGTLTCVWFRARNKKEDCFPVQPEDRVVGVIELRVNRYLGRETVSPHVLHLMVEEA